MTTPINTFQDILDAMERDPALRDALRRHILDDEFLAFPAQVKALTEAVEALVNETRELRAWLEQLQAGQEELRADVSEIRIEMGRMEGNVSHLMGTDYEGEVARVANRLVRRNLGFADPEVVMKRRMPNATPPLPEVDQAANRGDITWDEADDLVMADVIVSGAGQDGKQVYVLAEISITVQEKDKARAFRRAELLARVTGVTTIPVVMGKSDEDADGDSAVAFWQFDPDA